MPSVSVIIPTYNRCALLARALDSVLAQTRCADEVIVVDDGSQDGTADFVRHAYPQVHLLVQRNAGVSAARNRGITCATGEWIALLDSDDVWLPTKLAMQLQALTQQPGFRLVHCDEVWIRKGVRVNPMKKHKKRGGFIFQYCLPLCCISPSSVLIERSVFETLGNFDESLPACEDYDLWLRICAREPVLYLDQPLLQKYGGHSDQLSQQYWGMDRFRIQALQKILTMGVLSEQDRVAVKAMLVKKAAIFARGAEKHGREELARYYWGLSIG